MAGTWADLGKQPGVSVGTMLLLTDGTVMAHEFDTSNWHRLTPNASGNYSSGTWSALPAMPPNSAIPASENGPAYGPRFFGSAVLGDGTVLVIGGEYNFGKNVDVAAATRFNPVTSQWTNVPTPSGWSQVGDVPLCVLADGRVLIGNIDSNQTALFDPVAGTFSAAASKGDRCAEESFALLPDGTVLAVDCSSIPDAEKYLPSLDTWVPAGQTPTTLPQSCPGIVAEIGPTVLLPNGRALVIGASGDMATYIPPANPADPGIWAQSPTIADASGTLHPIDAPAVLLPNGKVLLTASPAPPCSFPGPTHFFEYDPATDTLSPAPSPSNSGGPCFTGRFLLLPNGQVLFSSQSSKVTIYTPGGGPQPSWKPAVTAVPAFMAVGHDYLVSGTQFNGLSQACYYGDDATMATNYPVIRLQQAAKVIYCRTAHHLTMGVATGPEVVSTIASIPPAVPPGVYDLVVVANGIPSDPLPVTIAAALPAIAANLQDGGNFGDICGPAYLTLRLFNVGGAPLIVDQVQARPPGGGFAVLPQPPAPLTIGPGDQVDFTIAAAPGAPGTVQTGTIRIVSNDPVTPVLDLEMAAVTGAGRLSTVIAGQGDFGEACPGSFRDEPLTLCNSGHCPLTVRAIVSSSAEFAVPEVLSYPLVIGSGDALAVPVRFQPTGPGDFSAAITIDSNDPAGPRVVTVSGRAAAGRLAVTGSARLGSSCYGGAETTISVCNVGGCALRVSGVGFLRESRHLSLAGNPFPAVLPPGCCLGVVIRYEGGCEPECCELVIESDDPVEPVKTVEVTASPKCRCGGERTCGCREHRPGHDEDRHGHDEHRRRCG